MFKIPKNYSGYVSVKMMKINDGIYYDSTLAKLDEKNSIKVKVCSYESQTFLYINNLSLEIYYLQSDNIYESVGGEDNGTYLIRFISFEDEYENENN